MRLCSNGLLQGKRHLLLNPKCSIGSPHRRSFTTIQSSTRFQARWPCRKHVAFLRRRTIFSDVSPFILVPGVFVGLLVRGERSLKNTPEAVDLCLGMKDTLDGTRLAIATARPVVRPEGPHDKRRKAVILYFQGNGASIPPRTPMLSNILRTIAQDSPIDWTLVALSYRGYWTSRGRAHQKGIEKDAEAFLNWTLDEYGKDAANTEFIIWGQSIGAGVASYAASKYLEKDNVHRDDGQSRPCISRLILETPFVSIRSMLAAIYPDKWVPYKHLWPFLRSWWDSEEALTKIAKAQHPPKVLLVIAARDEIVPRVQADQLEELCKDLQLDVTRKNVLGALHTQASTVEQGKRVISAYLREENIE